MTDGQVIRVTPTNSLTPLVEDQAALAIRKRWTGRSLWPYGGHRFSASLGGLGAEAILDSPATDPLRIVGIFRLRQPKTSISLADESAMREGESVLTDTPILVLVRPPRGVGPSGWSGFDDGAVRRLTKTPTKDLIWNDEFADEGHLYRTFSFKAPSRRAREAARSCSASPGMTPDEAAWGLGWPPIRGSLASLRQLSVWNYPAPAPFSSSVTFRNGRVVAYSPPGNLP